MPQRLLLPLLAITFAGCATYKKYGDVTLLDRKDIVWTMLDELRFQHIPLDEPSTKVWRIRALPVGILPTAYYITVPFEEHSKHLTDQPWRDVVILVEAVDLRGKILYTRKIDFSKDWKGSSMPGPRGQRRIWILGTDWRENLSNPQFQSYDLRVTVLSPSKRPSDSLQVEAMTRIQGDYLK